MDEAPKVSLDDFRLPAEQAEAIRQMRFQDRSDTVFAAVMNGVPSGHITSPTQGTPAYLDGLLALARVASRDPELSVKLVEDMRGGRGDMYQRDWLHRDITHHQYSWSKLHQKLSAAAHVGTTISGFRFRGQTLDRLMEEQLQILEDPFITDDEQASGDDRMQRAMLGEFGFSQEKLTMRIQGVRARAKFLEAAKQTIEGLITGLMPEVNTVGITLTHQSLDTADGEGNPEVVDGLGQSLRYDVARVWARIRKELVQVFEAQHGRIVEAVSDLDNRDMVREAANNTDRFEVGRDQRKRNLLKEAWARIGEKELAERREYRASETAIRAITE